VPPLAGRSTICGSQQDFNTTHLCLQVAGQLPGTSVAPSTLAWWAPPRTCLPPVLLQFPFQQPTVSPCPTVPLPTRQTYTPHRLPPCLPVSHRTPHHPTHTGQPTHAWDLHFEDPSPLYYITFLHPSTPMPLRICPNPTPDAPCCRQLLPFPYAPCLPQPSRATTGMVLLEEPPQPQLAPTTFSCWTTPCLPGRQLTAFRNYSAPST